MEKHTRMHAAGRDLINGGMIELSGQSVLGPDLTTAIYLPLILLFVFHSRSLSFSLSPITYLCVTLSITCLQSRPLTQSPPPSLTVPHLSFSTPVYNHLISKYFVGVIDKHIASIHITKAVTQNNNSNNHHHATKCIYN